MLQIKKNLEESIHGGKTVFLFTGDKGSTLLINVIKDLTAVQAGMNVSMVFIDTGCHFDEIIDYVKSLDSKIEIIKNNEVSIDHTVDMDKCCGQRKVEALKEYLDNIKSECLIVPFIDEEKGSGIEDSYLNGINNIKIIKPLADLTDRDVWRKIKKYELPFSTIYNKGYKIVDCECCTTRHGRKKQHEDAKDKGFDKETEEKLKSLGYM